MIYGLWIYGIVLMWSLVTGQCIFDIWYYILVYVFALSYAAYMFRFEFSLTARFRLFSIVFTRFRITVYPATVFAPGCRLPLLFSSKNMKMKMIERFSVRFRLFSTLAAIMEEQGWWEIVEPPEAEAGNTLTAAQMSTQTTKDKKIQTHLFQCVSDELLMQVVKKKTGREVWEALKARFVGAERVRYARLQNLKSEFDALAMKDTESIDEFARKLTAMSVKYSNLGGTLEDSVMVKKLLDTVPERFIQCVAGIEQFCDLKTLVLDDAIGRLKTFEERTKRGAGGVRSENGQVLLTQAEWDARQK